MGSTVQLLIEVLDLDLRPYECKHSCDYPHRFRFVFSLYLCLSAGETPLPSGSLQAQIESLEFFFLMRVLHLGLYPTPMDISGFSGTWHAQRFRPEFRFERWGCAMHGRC